MKCPKCNYERQPADEAPDWQCPSCKVAYVKALQAREQAMATASTTAAYARKALPPVAEVEDEDIDPHERHSLAAHGQKMVIRSILLNFVLRAVGQSHVLPALAVEALFMAVAIYSLMGVLKICSGIEKSQNQKILFMVLSFFPVVNLLTLLYLNFKVSKTLREAGWEVGLLGAKP